MWLSIFGKTSSADLSPTCSPPSLIPRSRTHTGIELSSARTSSFPASFFACAHEFPARSAWGHFETKKPCCARVLWSSLAPLAADTRPECVSPEPSLSSGRLHLLSLVRRTRALKDCSDRILAEYWRAAAHPRRPSRSGHGGRAAGRRAPGIVCLARAQAVGSRHRRAAGHFHCRCRIDYHRRHAGSPVCSCRFRWQTTHLPPSRARTNSTTVWGGVA
jgi:hypothetical protein